MTKQKNIRIDVRPLAGRMAFRCDVCGSVAYITIGLTDIATLRSHGGKITGKCSKGHPMTVHFRSSR